MPPAAPPRLDISVRFHPAMLAGSIAWSASGAIGLTSPDCIFFVVSSIFLAAASSLQRSSVPPPGTVTVPPAAPPNEPKADPDGGMTRVVSAAVNPPEPTNNQHPATHLPRRYHLRLHQG